MREANTLEGITRIADEEFGEFDAIEINVGIVENERYVPGLTLEVGKKIISVRVNFDEDHEKSDNRAWELAGEVYAHYRNSGKNVSGEVRTPSNMNNNDYSEKSE